MHKPAIWYDLSRKPERRWLGLCLACHYLLVSTAALALHECGHAIAHLAQGETVYGFHVTPFSGQVLALYPAHRSVFAALEDLAGIALTQVIFFVWAGMRITRARWTTFFWDSLQLMFLILLALDAVYVLVSGPIHFGDVYQAAKNLGWSPFIFLAPGVLMCWVNYRIVRRLIRDWSGRYFAGSTAGSQGMVLRWFLVPLLTAIVIYWAIISPLESPW